MAELEVESLDGLFGGDDLLDLLDMVQNKQDSGETVDVESLAAVSTNENSLTSSEEAYQKLMKSLGTEEAILLESGSEAVAESTPAPAHSMEEYDKSVYGYPQLDEIEKGLQRGLDVSFYDSAELTFRQMREIRIGLEQGLDVSWFCSKYFKDSQMREIRLGLMEGLDVSGYARLIYSLPDMQRRRQELLKAKYARNADNMDFQVRDPDTEAVIYTMDKLMSAYIQLKKPLPEKFSRKNLEVLLRIYGIEYGLLLQELGEPGKLPVGEAILVAKGEYPVTGEDGFYEYFVDDLDEMGPHVDEDGNVDYMAQKQFCYIQPGQKVALYHPATYGKPGKTVKGMELLTATGRNLPRLSLEKIRILDDGVTYVSKKEGYVSLNNGILNIVELLEFKEDIGYGNNIKFDGNIYIRANVLESAVIQAGGDIIVEGFVESAILKSGKDIILRKGVNADNKGEIEAAGNIVSAFLENANVIAGGSIEADYILNSTVFSGDKVTTKGRRSMICGGRVCAKNGIETGIVGNKFQIKTTLEAGNSSERSERTSALYRRRKELAAEMEKVREGMNTVLRKVGALNGRTNPIYLKFQDVLEQQKKEMAALNQMEEEEDVEMNNASRIFVSIATIAYENTKLVINGVSRVLKQDIVKARFFSKGREISYDRLADSGASSGGQILV
ncbi:MAG: FapA family protein [Lachnospiraceae bacterium]|nr:FapA family protein [Lachnospiraceae bacterium]